MKKVLAIVLAVVMLFSFAACGSQGANHGYIPEDVQINEVDLSKYPADFSQWTAQNIMDYFWEAVDYPRDCETWLQNHAEDWAGMPIYEASGIWNADGADDILIVFFTFDPTSPDTTPEAVEEVKEIIRNDKNHDYTQDGIYLGPQDHMVGHVSFSYGFSTYNEEYYNKTEAAYNQLVESMGLTPDF